MLLDRQVDFSIVATSVSLVATNALQTSPVGATIPTPPELTRKLPLVSKLKIAVVGCGGMGNRHLRGLKKLEDSGMSRVELAGLVEPSEENAQIAADEAEKLFGFRPPVVRNLEELPQAAPDVQALDVTTGPWLHHGIVCQAVDSLQRRTAVRIPVD